MEIPTKEYLKILGVNQVTELIENQKLCARSRPITTHATFKLSLLRTLIKQIEDHPDYDENASEDETHFVCVTLVREHLENVATMPLYDEKHIDTLKKHSTTNKSYSQVIPILAGCVCKLDAARKTKSFKYMSEGDKENEVVYVLKPGGEGTGLIPPPPPSGGL